MFCQELSNKKLKKIIKLIIVLLIVIALILGCYKCFNIEEKILRYVYPKKYSEYVYKYSEELGIDPLLTLSIIKTESNFKENTVSRSGAIGLMQLMDNTAKEQAQKLNIEYQKETLYDPEKNIQIGLTYFKNLLDQFNENYVLAFAAYNAGIGNVKTWILEGKIKSDGSDYENIPFPETNMYVRKVVRNYKIYKELY